MAIAFHCQCGKTFKADEDCGGMTGKCDRCGRRFVVPALVDVGDDRLPLSFLAATVPDSSPLPDQPMSAQASSPAWRDPIIMYGAGVPILFLLIFFAFIAGANYPRDPGRQAVQELKSRT